jgi:S-DNA-T family DNA segregation ATPase FtsK/SpoIIIE
MRAGSRALPKRVEFMTTKGKSTKTRSGAGRTARKRSAPRQPKRSQKTQPNVYRSALVDIVILLSLALAVFTAFAVYNPGFTRPVGEAVHDLLQTWTGVGMYLVPLLLLLVPAVLISTRFHRTFLKAWAWVWCLTLLASLVGGMLDKPRIDQGYLPMGWGGLLGDSCAAVGYDYLGVFYPVLVAVVALIVFGRLAGRSLIIPLLRGTYRAAVRTGEAAVDIGYALKEEATELAEERKQRLATRKEQEDARRERRKAILAAELEAADAPEGDSPVIRNNLHPATGLQSIGNQQPVAAESGAGDDFAEIVNAAGAMQTSGFGETYPIGDEPWSTQQEGGDIPGTDTAAGVESVRQDAALQGGLQQVSPALVDGNEGQLNLFPSTQAGYELPSVQLLRDAPSITGEEQYLEPRAKVIEHTLRSFNIDAQCFNSVVGPRVTRFELKIGPGINVSRIHSLADNLALELAVKAVRIEAPIPGKSAVGVEVPNASMQLVTLRNILESPLNQRANHPLTVGLGRDIAGNPIIANLAKMPHVLVAGATGSGKSVCLNALIISLLARNAPDTLRLILIDPKRVEMTNYIDLPHLACPVVHDVHEAQSALKWAVAEMDRRYRLLEQARARNIAAYNEQAAQEETLPYIVIVVDELADLMMLAGQVIEKLICRIAQLSRAVGIHLVIATQRPDVKVITGTIKANIPSRIAFAVVSHIDSRTILDSSGADKLLGSGDMLFAPIGENVPLRVQGAFVSDEEIDAVVEWCRGQAKAHYDESITQFEFEESSSLAGLESGKDELFGEAREIVQQTQRASTSYLQRRLKIGYNRAARIMEELEAAGVVTAPDAQGSRKVL